MALVKIPGEPALLPMLIVLACFWLLPRTSIPIILHQQALRQYSHLPAVKFDLHPTKTFLNRYSNNKTALYIETRNDIRHITPLLLHMMEVVPPEWRFLYLGSHETVKRISKSSPVRRYQEWGKLRLETISPLGWGWEQGEDVSIDELHNRLLTNTGFFENELAGTEWLLVFHSDAIMCANSNRDVNEFLQYDWVGAPWNLQDRFGGNGGLSLRRVSKMIEVLQFQTRLDNSFSEDQWMASRVGLLPGANMASPDVEKEFAVEDIWAEKPMGYHINPTMGPGNSPDVWDDPEKRRLIYDYCPEIKIILDMRLEREQCGSIETPMDWELPVFDKLGNVIEAELPLLTPDTELAPDFMKAMEAVELLEESNEAPSESRDPPSVSNGPLSENEESHSRVEEQATESEDPASENAGLSSESQLSPSQGQDQAAEHDEPVLKVDGPPATSQDAPVAEEKKKDEEKNARDGTDE